MPRPMGRGRWASPRGEDHERPVGSRALSIRRVTTATVVLAALVAAGCAATGEIDNTDNSVILVIDSISPVSAPFGDVVTSGGTILDDDVEVTFAAHPKSPAVQGDIGPTLTDVVVERYEVTFERTDGGNDVPSGFQRDMNLRVRSTPQGQVVNFTTSTQLVLVPSTIKAQPPISFLVSPGFEPGTGFVNIQVNATVRFFGRTLAGQRVSATGSIGINFADFADSN